MRGYVRVDAGCVPRKAVAPKEEPAASAVGERPAARGSEAVTPAEATEPETSKAPADFALLYESRDKALCLFELSRGGLQAVPSVRLA
ncbi:MAG: hypothetical protein Q4D06_03955 [Coriobacteriia bacterium]|nr:hypothetical protein [Coriobacteriia bacterium]